MIEISSEQEMLDFGAKVAKEIARGGARVIELVGDVGVGKTTFVRGLARGLGVKEAVTSPSFTISKSYALPDGSRLVHYDFYRLPDPGIMAEDLAEVISERDDFVVVEWGDSVQDLLPEERLTLRIGYTDEGKRTVEGARTVEADGKRTLGIEDGSRNARAEEMRTTEEEEI